MVVGHRAILIGLGDDHVEAVDECGVSLRFVVPAAARRVVGEGLGVDALGGEDGERLASALSRRRRRARAAYLSTGRIEPAAGTAQMPETGLEPVTLGL